MKISDEARERVAEVAMLQVGEADALLPFHATMHSAPLVDRMREMLAVAFGGALTPKQETELVHAADAALDDKVASDSTLECWLRERAFRQHCTLFEQRPFLWQIWDGLRDGFSTLLNYHRLDHAALEKVTFTLLGDWIAKARAESRTAHADRALQLQQQLRSILDGESPHDIFVRWKSISKQAIGWRPDLDDGVRLNIRPFVLAGVLRDQPRITWSKDRGTDTTSAPWHHLGPQYGGKEGDRINDHHLTLAEKLAARGRAA